MFSALQVSCSASSSLRHICNFPKPIKTSIRRHLPFFKSQGWIFSGSVALFTLRSFIMASSEKKTPPLRKLPNQRRVFHKTYLSKSNGKFCAGASIPLQTDYRIGFSANFLVPVFGENANLISRDRGITRSQPPF